MHVGLVTPPGLLGDFVARAVEPAGHTLCVAPSLHALLEQAEPAPDVVLFAPIVDDRPAHEALARARDEGLVTPRALYLVWCPRIARACNARDFRAAWRCLFRRVTCSKRWRAP